MLQFDGWKRFLIWSICAIGLLLALPNGFYTRVEQHNDAVQQKIKLWLPSGLIGCLLLLLILVLICAVVLIF